MTYFFRRSDTDEVITVDFETMIQQDSLGIITLPDGVQARRCTYLEVDQLDKLNRDNRREELNKPVLSDSLGFTVRQLKTFEADRVKHGFTGIEFVPDPHVPTFYQVKCTSPAEWARYVAHRGFNDKNSRNGGGQALTADQLQKASERVIEYYGASQLTPR